jgi:hypothetical protein
MNEWERRGVYKLNDFISASNLLCSFITKTSYQLNSGYVYYTHKSALRDTHISIKFVYFIPLTKTCTDDMDMLQNKLDLKKLSVRVRLLRRIYILASYYRKDIQIDVETVSCAFQEHLLGKQTVLCGKLCHSFKCTLLR